MTTIAMRLHPRSCLAGMLDRFVEERDIAAACVVSGVGDLDAVRIELPSGEHLVLKGKHALCSLQGSLAKNGHSLHVTVANDRGEVFGGRLVSARVVTSVEVVVQVINGMEFSWVMDGFTGADALRISPVSAPRDRN